MNPTSYCAFELEPALEGFAGGRLELALVRDFVIATRLSRWGMPEIDWGIAPGWGGTSRLARVG